MDIYQPHTSASICHTCGATLSVIECKTCNGIGGKRYLGLFRHTCKKCAGTGEIKRCPDTSKHVVAFSKLHRPQVFGQYPKVNFGQFQTKLPGYTASQLPEQQTPATRCPTCHGTGIQTIRMRNPDLGQYHFMNRKTVHQSFKCTGCDGSGEVRGTK